MKNLLLFSFFAICLLASCGDGVECTQAEYVGTWTGTESCGADTPVDVTINITAVGSDRLLIDGGRFVTDEVDINNCSVSEKNTTFGIGWEYSGDISGTSLTLEHKEVGVGSPTTCSYTLTKQ